MASAPSSWRLKSSSKSDPDLSVDLSAVIMAATPHEPRVLTVHFDPQQIDALPSGPLQSQHRTLEMGLRAWVAQQTELTLGYVEQLYTFGDRDRAEADVHGVGHSLSIAYLALVREARPAGLAHAAWRNWYSFLPWEDWREGRPKALDVIEPRLKALAKAGGKSLRSFREERIELTFGFEAEDWTDERVLERMPFRGRSRSAINYSVAVRYAGLRSWTAAQVRREAALRRTRPHDFARCSDDEMPTSSMNGPAPPALA